MKSIKKVIFYTYPQVLCLFLITNKAFLILFLKVKSLKVLQL
ncbi:hypothetical protein QE417_004196 [Mucilaginibacter terrae]|uniref:Uncharacterized protein n=1 Tax=Mucilaginibacter terrae TaxID=1955052 RepID=A0ABU3GZD6_9SPHI|nr:hypothetical protein [Mucilaginibacter terrae]